MGNNKHAGPDAVNRIRIFGHGAAKGANAIVVNYKGQRDITIKKMAPAYTAQGFKTRLSLATFEARLLAIELVYRLAELWRWTVQLLKKKDVGGLEDMLEKRMSKRCKIA